MTDVICFQVFLILGWLNPWTGTVWIQRTNWISVLDFNVKHIPSYEPVTKVGKSLMELTFQIATLKLPSCSPFQKPLPVGLPATLNHRCAPGFSCIPPLSGPWSSGAMLPVVDEGKVPVEASWHLISLPEARGSLLDHRMQEACLRFLAKKNVIPNILGGN